MLMTLDGSAPTPAEQIDLYPPELYRSGQPHTAWLQLRQSTPVRLERTPEGAEFWSVTGYHDTVRVLRDTARFSSEYSTMLSVLGDGDSARGKAIHLTDAPRHGDIRATAIPSLSMRVFRERQGVLRTQIGDLIDRAVNAREADFAHLISVLPMLTAGQAMGIPEKKWDEAAHWTIASMAPDDPHYAAGDPRMTLMQAHVYLFTMFSDLIAERRRSPGTDLVSLLLDMRIDGRPATEEEVLVNCYAFIMGANPTVPQVAAHLMLVLAERPEILRQVRERPEIVPAVVEEALRWASPVNHLLRRTREEVQLGEHTIPAGGLVAVWLASANRDEAVFADPYTFQPDRKPNPHVAYGTGEHRCIGNAAAQLGLKLFIEELAARVGEIEIAGPVRHLASNFLNGITSLPVRLAR
jgi:cytochrome P450